MSSYEYYTHYPDEYGATGRQWPVIIALHGAGERNVLLHARGPMGLREIAST